MKKIIKSLLGAVLMACTPLSHAADAVHGKALHDAHCTACHATMTSGNPTAIFTRSDSIIHSFDSLKKRVRFCETMAGTSWKDAEIDDVVAYLNQDFYKFEEKNP